MKTNNIIAAPAAWTSAYAFEDNILESGANYCIESMNAVDYANETFKPKTVMAVHLAGDYGDDAAAGAKIAAEKLGMTFVNVKTDSGTDKQAGAVTAIVTQKPDLVILTTGPAERPRSSAAPPSAASPASSSAPARPGTRASSPPPQHRR